MRRLLAPLAASLLAAAGMAAFATAGSDTADRGKRTAPKYAIGLWGDLPYNERQKTVGVPNLIADMNAQPLSFSVFDGDLKNGSSVCADSVFTDAIARFNSLLAPAVYLPGDNEWTDCHRKNNNASPPDPALRQPYDNLERLAFLRRTMYASPSSFGQRKLKLRHQGTVAGTAYPENQRWRAGGVVYAGLHVVGSNNNRIANLDVDESATSFRTRAQRVADQAEFVARDAATRAWMRGTFAEARTTNAAAVMLVMQANPIFDSPDTAVDERVQAGDDGFKAFLDDLRTETIAFGKPVVLVHGDSHYFRIDKPMEDAAGLRVENFTRLETFGETDADVHWVKVRVDPGNREVFSFEPQIVPANRIVRTR